MLLLASCKKERMEESIVGRWELQKMYDGYANGGKFEWTIVPLQCRYILEFDHNGGFKQIESVNINPQNCTGKYILQSGPTLHIETSYYLNPQNLNISLSKGSLEITHQAREGVIIERFVKL
jgi:hypothetical protein